MGPSGSAPNATQEDIRGLFSQLDEPCAPLSTGEVAEKLDCPKRTARQNLEALAERDELQTRQVDDQREVWWSLDRVESVQQQPESREFDAFVEPVQTFEEFWLSVAGYRTTNSEPACCSTQMMSQC